MKRENVDALFVDRERNCDEIVSLFNPLVISVAKKCCDKVTDDVLQEGYVGLLRAIRFFDSSKGVRFVTYAYIVIRGTILSYVQSDNFFGCKRFGMLTQRFIRKCNKYNWRREKIDDAINDVKNGDRHISFRELRSVASIYDNGVKSLGYVGDVPVNDSDSIADIENRDELEFVKRMLMERVNTSKRNKDIFIRYFFNGEDARSIASMYNISPNRVYQLNGRISRSLRCVLSPYNERVSA